MVITGSDLNGLSVALFLINLRARQELNLRPIA